MRTSAHTSTNRLIALTFLVLTVALVVVFSLFNTITSSEVSEKTSEMLSSEAQQQALYVETVLDGQFRTLESVAAHMGATQLDDTAEFAALANAMKIGENFARLIVSDPEGNCFTSDGDTTHISHQQYFKDALAGNRTVSEPLASSLQKDYVYVMLMVPIKSPEGEIRGTLGGSYTASYFESLFLDNESNSIDSALLVDDEGTVIASRSADGANRNGLNLFSNGFSTKFLDGNSLDTMHAAMQEGAVLTTLAKNREGEEIYTTQVPFGYNGWTLLTSVDRSKVDDYYAFIKQNMAWVNAAVTCAFLISLAFLLIILMRDRKRLREDNRLIQEEKMALMLSEERYRLIARDSEVIVFEINTVDESITFSENFEKRFNRKPSYQSFFDGGKVHPDDRELFRQAIAKLDEAKGHVSERLRFCDADGGSTWYSLILSPIFDDGGALVRILGKLTDIDATVRAMELLEIKAQTDSATGLYDKQATQTLIDQALEQDDSDDRGVQALAIVDIDNLKTINDTQGHLQGDRAIAAVADSLKRNFRDTDIVGRIGGDEFMVLIKGLEGQDQAQAVVSSFMDRSANLVIGEHDDIPLRCSVGVAVTQPDDTFEALYKRADAALYRVKKSGKRGFAFWNGESAS